MLKELFTYLTSMRWLTPSAKCDSPGKVAENFPAGFLPALGMDGAFGSGVLCKHCLGMRHGKELFLEVGKGGNRDFNRGEKLQEKNGCVNLATKTVEQGWQLGGGGSWKVEAGRGLRGPVDHIFQPEQVEKYVDFNSQDS